MKMSMKSLRCLLAILMVMFLVGCGNQTGTINSGDVQNENIVTELPEEDLVSVQESYEYTTMIRVYANPAMLTVERQVEYLSLSMDDGFFFCETTNIEKADEFVNAQRTLLQFLRDSGVNTEKLNYYAMNTDDSFSESEKKRAHIALPHIKSYEQVLITLQTLWGDYTDYGYIHAVSNAIAAHLGWQTEMMEETEQTALDAFFAENPVALNLLYPCFTETYASAETVRNCKALSKQLLGKVKLRETLAKPVSEQVGDFRALVDAYAQRLSVVFTRQTNGYAYYGEYLPLRISTPYVLHFVDRDYEDYYLTQMKEQGDDTWDYFSDYRSIFETIDSINEEITRSVSHFGLEDTAGIVYMYWLSTESSVERFNRPDYNYYVLQYEKAPFDGTIYLTQINVYLHEYFHHIDAILSGWLYESWQEQAFADLGDTQSQYARYVFEWPFLHNEEVREMFYYVYGREYQGGVEDYYDAYDILCFSWDSYDLDYDAGRNAWKSFTHYLLSLYEEDTVAEIFLFPETVETVTGKTWEELRVDWQHYMDEKFADVLSN